MAHSCPNCDQVCHCGGDIDDMIMDGTPEQDRCKHWEKCEDVPEDDDDIYDFWDDSDVPEPTCRVCGCTQNNACVHPKHGNCGWAESDLCTHCRDYPGESKRYNEIMGLK